MQILTDCSADLSPEDLREGSIAVAPLFIQFPEGEVNATDLSPDQFYTRLRAMQPRLPTTAQPSPGILAQMYRKLAQADPEILSIHISSGLSGTLGSARLGAEQAPEARVTFVDSLTLSGGLRFQVLVAAMAARAGWSREALLARLSQIQTTAEVVYTLETLEYLARGGRIGRVQALAGSLLKIKPIIGVDHHDGKYNTLGRARTIPYALQHIAHHLATKFGHETPLWMTVLHGQLPDRAQDLAQALAPFHVARLEVMRISPVLGVHTGPGIVGVAAMPMELARL